MGVKNIPYQSFCWVVGTTSFRTAKLNFKIEQQLLLLNEFYGEYMKRHQKWQWNNATQAEYYDFMKAKGFLTGDAPRKDKDAREKTSGLVDIGLITEDRIITVAGKELLAITAAGDFKKDSRFNIDKDSLVYFKQLLKTTIKVNKDLVRPYFVLAKALVELGSLSYNEFTYLLPLARTKETTENMITKIKDLRAGNTCIEDIIFENLMSMDNYQLAQKIFRANDVSEEIIYLIGMNRKSRDYDKPYYALYNKIEAVFLNKDADEVYNLYWAAKAINQKPGVLWRKLLFNISNGPSIRRQGIKALSKHSPFFACQSEKQLRETFFKYLHVFKAMATLSDYFDLNRRYFNLTDTLIFEDQMVKFDLIPKHFFASCMDDIYEDAFVESVDLMNSIPLEAISKGLVFDERKIYAKVSKELGISIQTPEQATSYIKDERYRRFNSLIDKKFHNSILEELLSCFETRDDARIEELVTDEADIPTIFEYILGIIWYKVSERQGNILDYMKLSLDANLLPKSHATGGTADIIYDYDECEEYPEHSLLIEATLADGKNQRRIEMEPVSRHLGEHRLQSGNHFDYSLFISTYLHINVMNDFRLRKSSSSQYFGNDGQYVEGMKIIPIDTQDLKCILNNGTTYKYLYGIFERHHQSNSKLPAWRDSLVKEVRGGYIIRSEGS